EKVQCGSLIGMDGYVVLHEAFAYFDCRPGGGLPGSLPPEFRLRLLAQPHRVIDNRNLERLASALRPPTSPTRQRGKQRPALPRRATIPVLARRLGVRDPNAKRSHHTVGI